MIAEIISTGDEIRSGALVDSNSAHIAQKLEETGLEVVRHTCVGDDPDMLEAVFREIGGRSDIAVVTGGLGPTTDDLTAQAAANAAGVSLAVDNTALSSVEAFFKQRNFSMSPSNKKQAMLPEGADCLYNPVGSAPGFVLKIGNCQFFFVPGVPFEMRKMISDSVLPRIEKLQGGNRNFCMVKTISTFGLTESATGERLAGLTEEFPGIRLGLRAKFPEIQVKLYANGEDEDTLGELIENAAKRVLQKTGKKAFSSDGTPMEAVVGDLLNKKNATLAVAESCTGGLISHWMTNVAGSSDYFLFSGVTYSNDAKINVLGVSPDTLRQYGAVHEETAKEMAEGARRVAGAVYGLSTSGIAGPGGGTDEKPVGTVCIGLAAPEGVKGLRFNFSFGRRAMNKTIFAMTALDFLRRELLVS
ncbi:competence/damage-inducible protein A [Desulfonema magnum]|uniref:CinA-like protein n=1 Tax=Desulfonema magnum TaxID=45655 RepID=A0A975BFX3_9BACT|nr:competence/damage-inducible protein A [Desulfonema magnum]QTA85009.1 Competence-induced protein, CinA-like [Desulfonema magnum]